MVETGHGTGDNFTGQVMNKKTCSKTYYALCSVAARYGQVLILYIPVTALHRNRFLFNSQPEALII
jgi:hypothetical protein